MARSLRSTLLAWNTGVVMGLLALFGVGVTIASQARLRSELDHDLEMQGKQAAQLGPLPGNRPPRPEGDDVPERFRPLFEPARRLANVRQPRFYDPEGFGLRPPRRAPGPEDPLDLGPEPEQGQRFSPPDPDPIGRQQALKGKTLTRTVQWEGEPLRVRSTPFIRQGEVIGVVQTSRELTEVENLLKSQLITLGLFLPLAGLMAAAAARTLANRALRPIGAVTRAASEISGNDLNRRLEVSGEDELADMARTFNAMLGRLDGAFADQNRANDRLHQALESQRRFTADASHELRTPLTRIRLASNVIESGEVDPTRLREALEVTNRSAEQMSRLVDQLLTLARVDAGQLPVHMELLDLRVVAAEAIDMVPGAENRIVPTFPDYAVSIYADPDHLRRIAVNLMENAVRYAGDSAQVWLRVDREGDGAVLEVGDNGVGIPADHLPHLFERFYRVDTARTSGGSGLGLAICHDLARANRCELSVESRPGSGTVFRLRSGRS